MKETIIMWNFRAVILTTDKEKGGQRDIEACIRVTVPQLESPSSPETPWEFTSGWRLYNIYWDFLRGSMVQCVFQLPTAAFYNNLLLSLGSVG